MTFIHSIEGHLLIKIINVMAGDLENLACAPKLFSLKHEVQYTKAQLLSRVSGSSSTYLKGTNEKTTGYETVGPQYLRQKMTATKTAIEASTTFGFISVFDEQNKLALL